MHPAVLEVRNETAFENSTPVPDLRNGISSSIISTPGNRHGTIVDGWQQPAGSGFGGVTGSSTFWQKRAYFV